MRLLFAALLLAASLFGQSDFYLKDGDRVVFYGDSITDQRLYTTFTESFVRTRFPTMDVSFVHSGWGGDRVSGGGGGPIDIRLERDVFAYKPTVLTIMLGMNDGSYRAFQQPIFERYTSGYEYIIQSVKSKLPEVRITAIEPSPYDDVTRKPAFTGGYNAVLVRYGEYLRELAAKEKLDVADLNTSVVAALTKAHSIDPELAKKLLPDRVHPAAAGHLLMAAALLKAWHAPGMITAVEIDASAKKITAATNTVVSNLEIEPIVTWTQQDAALPAPIDTSDPLIALALHSSDFASTLDRQPLKVTGLPKARYILRIDGEQAGSYSREELAEGIDLALAPTPMLRQSLDVHALTLKRTLIHNTRWRQLQVPLADDKFDRLQPAIQALDALEAEMIAQQRETAQPKLRHYELAPE